MKSEQQSRYSTAEVKMVRSFTPSSCECNLLKKICGCWHFCIVLFIKVELWSQNMSLCDHVRFRDLHILECLHPVINSSPFLKYSSFYVKVVLATLCSEQTEDMTTVLFIWPFIWVISVELWFEVICIKTIWITHSASFFEGSIYQYCNRLCIIYCHRTLYSTACVTWGSHVSDYEVHCLLRCDVV
jgi:hypothetical protein